SLRRGTLIVFRLRAMYAAMPHTDLAFSRTEWSRCPAHDLVPRLFVDVARTAVRLPAYATPRRSWVGRVIVPAFRVINHWRPWHRLPTWLGVVNLVALRIELRENNL